MVSRVGGDTLDAIMSDSGTIPSSRVIGFGIPWNFSTTAGTSVLPMKVPLHGPTEVASSWSPTRLRPDLVVAVCPKFAPDHGNVPQNRPIPPCHSRPIMPTRPPVLVTHQLIPRPSSARIRRRPMRRGRDADTTRSIVSTSCAHLANQIQHHLCRCGAHARRRSPQFNAGYSDPALAAHNAKPRVGTHCRAIRRSTARWSSSTVDQKRATHHWSWAKSLGCPRGHFGCRAKSETRLWTARPGWPAMCQALVIKRSLDRL